MKPLSRKDYLLLKRFFEHQPHRLSAYSLPSIIAWNGECFESYYEIVHDEVIVVTKNRKDNDDKKYMILPVSGHGRPTPARLKELSMATGCGRICFVPGDYLQEVGAGALDPYYEITGQQEYEDYLYRTQDIIELKGNRYSKKRNLIHQFAREYIHRNRVTTGRITGKDVSQCIDFLEKWCDL